MIALAIVLSSCSLVQVNEEKDRKTVVAEVNGVKIQKGDVLDKYHAFYGEAEEYDKDVLMSILDSLIEEELVGQKAESAGYTVNDEIQELANEEFEKTIKEYAEILKLQAGEDADPDKDYEQQAREELKQYIAASGQTEEEYIELLAKYIAMQHYFDELTGDVQVEDQEIEEYYQDQLEFQRDNPSMAANYSLVSVVKQPASRLVKHILIKLADEDSQAIFALRQEGKEEEADALRDEKLESIKANATKVLNKAKSGEDFDELVEMHGEDPGMEMEEYKDGYSMLRDESMMPEFLEASFQLNEGEISDLVVTDYGYHIIKVYEAKDDEIAPLEDVKEEIRTVLINRKKSEKTDEFISQWMEEAKIKKYEKRL